YAAFFKQGPLWRGFMNTVEYHGPRAFFLKIVTPDQFAPGGLARLLDLMSVRYYVTRRDLARERLPELERHVGGTSLQLGPAVLIERPQALPHVYTVHQVIAEPNVSRALGIVQDERFDPRRVAVVDRDAAPLGTSSIDDDVARIQSYAPDEVVVRVACA